MKKLLCFTVLFITSCQNLPLTKTETSYFYEKDFALPVDARNWAKTAPLKDLCEGTKNWRIESIRTAALNEIYARKIDTRQCYYQGLELTP